MKLVQVCLIFYALEIPPVQKCCAHFVSELFKLFPYLGIETTAGYYFLSSLIYHK
jgi:hypothetical protein